ncbi:MAG: hypothetical protein ACTHN5_13055 [Phycisphaerae bacterium]
MAMTRPQSQRDSNQRRGTDARATRGLRAKNKDHLKSDRQENMAGKPGAQKDRFGSGHNRDEVRAQQKKFGRPRGKQDLAFRESPQEKRKVTGERNREPGRRGQKSGAAKKRGAR